MPKSPLRYPGGKSRAIDVIMPYIRNLDCGELCSPFLGGGSLELACAAEGMTVHGYDINQPLVWFWQAWLQDPDLLLEYVERYRQSVKSYTDDARLTAQMAAKCSTKTPCEAMDPSVVGFCSHHRNITQVAAGSIVGIADHTFEDLRDLVNSHKTIPNPKTKRGRHQLFRAAAQYYIVNRTSFSGATNSGGWSWKASWARLTNSILEDMTKFDVKKVTVECLDFTDSIQRHSEAGLYLDPPYCLNEEPIYDLNGELINREKLYGNSGDLHDGFDHVGLYDILKTRSNWVLSYNDNDYIKNLYSAYEIITKESLTPEGETAKPMWTYGMANVKNRKDEETGANKMGEASEILILG
jgi:site-specific DNA-adenine methylase